MMSREGPFAVCRLPFALGITISSSKWKSSLTKDLFDIK
jgi:hypothetical protein